MHLLKFDLNFLNFDLNILNFDINMLNVDIQILNFDLKIIGRSHGGEQVTLCLPGLGSPYIYIYAKRPPKARS